MIVVKVGSKYRANLYYCFFVNDYVRYIIHDEGLIVYRDTGEEIMLDTYKEAEKITFGLRDFSNSLTRTWIGFNKITPSLNLNY